MLLDQSQLMAKFLQQQQAQRKKFSNSVEPKKSKENLPDKVRVTK
jgi:hypothetical protein